MRSRIQKILCLSLVAVTMLSCVACGKAKGEITGDAVARVVSEEDDDIIYIDDEAIALAGSLSLQDPALQQAAQEALALSNKERAAAGLSALAWSDGLAMAAGVRAQEIVGTFSHTRPDGSEWWTVNSNLMYGENLAKGYSSADAAVKAWMASPTHKANIMEPGFKTLGIAVYKADDGKWYWAQEFGY